MPNKVLTADGAIGDVVVAVGKVGPVGVLELTGAVGDVGLGGVGGVAGAYVPAGAIAICVLVAAPVEGMLAGPVKFVVDGVVVGVVVGVGVVSGLGGVVGVGKFTSAEVWLVTLLGITVLVALL